LRKAHQSDISYSLQHIMPAITVLRKRTTEIKFIEFLKSLQGVNQETLTSSIEYTELSDKLNEIIDQLPQRQKEVYLLHHEQGLKYNEIAGKLNISIKYN